LPAATTNSTSWVREIRLSACSIGDFPSEPDDPPMLMLTMSAPFAAAHSMPSTIPDSVP
jgi:hypothetical protein